MKKLILLLFASSTLIAQERFTFGINTELADKNAHNNNFDYGFNIGSHIELQGDLFYVRARVFWFPGLNDVSYFDFDGGGGLNWRSKFDEHRVYIGAFIGAINRLGWGHGKAGVELGYDYYFNNGFYLGLKTDYQYKHDDKIWRNKESGHSVKSIGLIFGLHW